MDTPTHHSPFTHADPTSPHHTSIVLHQPLRPIPSKTHLTSTGGHDPARNIGSSCRTAGNSNRVDRPRRNTTLILKEQYKKIVSPVSTEFQKIPNQTSPHCQPRRRQVCTSTHTHPGPIGAKECGEYTSEPPGSSVTPYPPITQI